MIIKSIFKNKEGYMYSLIENILVITIVAVAGLLVLRQVLNSKKQGSCCSCKNCKGLTIEDKPSKQITIK